MPRSGSDGYDTMHVCGYCIENLWSMSFIAQGFEKRIIEKKNLLTRVFVEVSYGCRAKFFKVNTFG